VPESPTQKRPDRLHTLASLIAPCDAAVETLETALRELLQEEAARYRLTDRSA
jgi:hypothetical protein